MEPSVPAVGEGIITIGGVGLGKWGGINITLQLEAKQSLNFPMHLPLILIEETLYDQFIDGVAKFELSLFYHVAGLMLEHELVEVTQPAFPYEPE